MCKINNMQKLLFPLCALFLLLACKSGDDSGANDTETESMEELMAGFTEIKLPFSLSDSIFQVKTNDSLALEYARFENLVKDSTILQVYQDRKPKVFPLGKFSNGEAESYLVYQIKGKPNTIMVSAVDENLEPKAGMVLLSDDEKVSATNQVNIDRNFLFYLIDHYKQKDGSTSSYSAVHAYNTAGLFMEIMNDGLKRGEKREIVNPIDSFPRTHKYAGDFGTNERNFISIRDGENEKSFRFFINMEKSAECVGEVKGEAVWITADSAFFNSTTDACAIAFKFVGNTVLINEVEGCGNRRPFECRFDASLPRMKKKK